MATSMSFEKTKCSVFSFPFFDVVIEVSLSVHSDIGTDVNPTEFKTLSTRVIAAIIESIFALYDVRNALSPSNFDPDENITFPRILSAKQKPYAAFPLSTDASVAMANRFVLASVTVLCNVLVVSREFPHICLIHLGEWSMLCLIPLTLF